MKLGKLALVGLTAILAFGATACGSSTANSTSSTTASSSTAESAAGSSDAADTSADSASAGEVQKVLIGIRQDLYPTSYINEQGEPAGYDIEILEKHHNQKIDAPSGTAELLYEVMAEEIDGVEACYDRSSRHEKRKKEEIGIQSLRGGTIFGEHTIMFAGVDEIIEIKHTALSKEVFVQGAISAAYALNDKDNGLFTLKSLY